MFFPTEQPDKYFTGYINMQHLNTRAGFTLIELLISIAIIGILTAIAIPSYQNYTRKARFTEIVQAMAQYKLGIEECFQLTADLNNCQPGKNGVPQNIEPGTGPGLIDSIIVSDNGEITITPRDRYGITAKDTYVLKPKLDKDRLNWTSSGGGVEHGYAN